MTSTDPAPSPQIADLPSDARRAIRKLSKQGNSVMIGIPPEFLHALNLLPGNRVELIFDREWEGFFVRRVDAPRRPPRRRAREESTSGAT